MRTVPLGEICQFQYGNSLPASLRDGVGYDVYGSNGVVGRHNKGLTTGPTVIIGRKGSVGEINFSDSSCWPIDTTYYVDSSSTQQNLRWLFYALKNLKLQSLNKATGVPGLNRNDAYRLEVPLPPLEEQKRIAAILDQADDIRRKRQHAIKRLNQLGQAIFHEMFGDVRTVSLGEIVEIKGGGTPDKSVESYWGGDIPWASVKDFKSAEITQTVDSITPLGVANSATNVIPAGSILVPTRMAVGKVAINAVDMAINQDLKALKLKAGVDTRYLLNALMAKAPSLEAQATGATVKGITLDVLRSLEIPLPPLEEQKLFGDRVQKIEKLMCRMSDSFSANKTLFASLQHRAFTGQL